MLTASSKHPTQISYPLDRKQNNSELGMPVLLKTASPDPEARSFLRIFNFVAWRPLSVYSLAQLRQRWRHFALVMGRRDPVAKVCELTINGSSQINLRIYFPDSGRELHPVLLWIHGGAFLIGELDTADSVCRNIANAGGCAVVAVQYRLAPEHDLHAGREDCKSALDWIFDHGAQFGLDPQRVAVGGDSAGGNIAAVLAQESVNREHPPLRLQVLAYPATNLVDEFASKNDNAKGYLLTAEAIDWVKSIVGPKANYRDSRLSPALSSDLAGQPPALLITAGFDPIRDDGLRYARRLREAGVPVELLHYAGQFHGFLNGDTVLCAARDALGRIGVRLAAVFAVDHNVTALDRTLEIAVPNQVGRPLTSALTEGLTTAFMALEWFEYQRNRIVSAFWPKYALPIASVRLLNLGRLLRGTTEAGSLRSRETFTGARGSNS